jgi:hypothetical protein
LHQFLLPRRACMQAICRYWRDRVAGRPVLPLDLLAASQLERVGWRRSPTRVRAGGRKCWHSSCMRRNGSFAHDHYERAAALTVFMPPLRPRRRARSSARWARRTASVRTSSMTRTRCVGPARARLVRRVVVARVAFTGCAACVQGHVEMALCLICVRFLLRIARVLCRTARWHT